MRKLTKKLLAVVLVLAMAFGATACYSEDNLWAAKKDDLTLPIGGYIYYLSSAYSSAAAKVNTDTNVLKATIEDKKAEDWIRDTAMDSVKNFYFVHQKFSELGLEMDEKDLENVDTYMYYYWSTSYETLGISESSMRAAGPELYVMQSMIFEAMYGKDGEKAVSDNELSDYYKDNYFSYEYFTASLSKTGEDDSTVDLTDDEKKTLKSDLEEMQQKIEAGDLTVTDAATAYQEKAELEASTYNTYTDTNENNYASEISTAAKALNDNAVTVLETTSSYVLIRKLPIADKVQEMLDAEDTRLSTLSSFKSEDFTAYLKEASAKVDGITFNTKSMNMNSLSKIAGDNKNGTSSVASETSETSTVSENSTAVSESSAESSAPSEASEPSASGTSTASESSAA